MRTKCLNQFVIWCFSLAVVSSSSADELIFSVGAGPQPGTDQKNQQVSLDYSFFEVDRSSRTRISIGVGYTYLKTDAGFNSRIEAFSLYPQLTFTPVRDSLKQYYFFVRALGPTYMSANELGDRKQSSHFTFQAQVGVGYRKSLNDGRKLLLQASWKHFSNANLYSDNDGIDIPFVLSVGFNF